MASREIRHPSLAPENVRRRVANMSTDKINKVRSQHRAHYVANAEYAKARHRKWCADNKGQVAAYNRRAGIKRRYGLTLEELAALLGNQGGECAICSVVITLDGPRGKSKAYVDHNHATGKIRSLLCIECNTAIGKFRENTEVMRKAIQYLETHNGIA